MANEKQKKEQTTDELLRDLLIVQLGLAGLAQHQIREIVGVDIHRVNRIVKHFKKTTKRSGVTQEAIGKRLHGGNNGCGDVKRSKKRKINL